jgi:hypothetical protein
MFRKRFMKAKENYLKIILSAKKNLKEILLPVILLQKALKAGNYGSQQK